MRSRCLPLADLFIATEAEVQAGGCSIPALDANAGGPVMRIDAKGFDIVPLVSLWCILAGKPFDANLFGQFDCVREESEDGPWTYRLPSDFADRLRHLDGQAISRVARDWA